MNLGYARVEASCGEVTLSLAGAEARALDTWDVTGRAGNSAVTSESATCRSEPNRPRVALVAPADLHPLHHLLIAMLREGGS